MDNNEPSVGVGLFWGEKTILERTPYIEEKQHVEDGGKAVCQRSRKKNMTHMQTNLAMLGLGFLI
jgi:hypothetical protein